MAYAEHVDRYLAAGWRCVLPVPVASKHPPPEGYTGESGADEIPADVLARWKVTRARHLLAVRLPAGVICIDVDHYDKTTIKNGEPVTVCKRGDDTLRDAESRWGPLPPTWASTARGNHTGPGRSRTLWYRVPAGRYATTLGDPRTAAVEILQRHHRYCVVPPSTNAHAGDAHYCWYTPSGTATVDIPRPEALPELPAAWVIGLSEGATRTTAVAAPAAAGSELLAALWADERTECSDVTNIRLIALDELAGASAGSRHDTATRRVYQLIRAGAFGHTGIGPALSEIQTAWEDLTAAEGRSGEFEAMCLSAARKAVTEVTATGSAVPVRYDPCLMVSVAAPPAATRSAHDDTDADVIEIPPPAAPVVWSRRALIGVESFDPPALVDHKLATAALERVRHVVRYLVDTGEWVIRDAHSWTALPKDLADWIITELYDLMPDGDPDSESIQAQQRATRKKKFGMNSSSSGVASKMRAMLRASGHPCTMRAADIDADPEILWAGGLPWDLRRCAERPTLALLAPDTPHLHSAGVAPSGLGLAHPTPAWDAFLAAIWPDPEVRLWAMRVISVSLTGYSDALMPVLWGETGRGKALDCETPIITTNGWSTMGDLIPGDEVFGPDGHPTLVVGAYDPQYNRKCYRVETSDGRSLIADAEHLWTVRTRTAGRRSYTTTLTTTEMLTAGIKRIDKIGGYRYYLPDQDAIISKPTELPIDPYLLGVWLGDGTSSNACLNLGDQDVDEIITNLSADGIDITNKQWRRTSWAVSPSIGRRGDFVRALRKLGVLNNKHIPTLYLTAGTEQRLALLQGLLDTDGHCGRGGAVEFTSVKEKLADGVLYLARSLGWKVSKSEGNATINGRIIGKKYRIAFRAKTTDLPPFRLSRQLKSIPPPQKGMRHNAVSIVAIKPVVSRPVRCIKVDRPDGLYLAGEGLIPTHNTSLVALIMSLLGSYATAADSRLLMSADAAHASIVYALKGVRLAFIDEGPREGKLATSRLKQLTGGGELTGNPMRGNPIQFTPTHTLILTCNPEETPTLQDQALRRRLRLIPCEGNADAVGAARAAITHAVWRAEAPGVLAQLMHHAAQWLADREIAGQWVAPESIRWRAEDIAAEEDPVKQWVEAEMEPHAEGSPVSDLLVWFHQWYRQLNPRGSTITSHLFGRRLTDLGYPRVVRRSGERTLRYRPLRRRAGQGGPGAPPTPRSSRPAPTTAQLEQITGITDPSANADKARASPPHKPPPTCPSDTADAANNTNNDPVDAVYPEEVPPSGEIN